MPKDEKINLKNKVEIKQEKNPNSLLYLYVFIVIGVIVTIIGIYLGFWDLSEVDKKLAKEASNMGVIEKVEYLKYLFQDYSNKENREKMVNVGQEIVNIASNDKEKAVGHYWIGIGYYGLEDFESSKKHEELSISLDPEFSGPYVTLGAIYLSEGNYIEAEKLAKNAIELDPEFGWAYNLLGLSLAYQGNKEEAIKNLAKAVSLSPTNKHFKDNLDFVKSLQ